MGFIFFDKLLEQHINNGNKNYKELRTLLYKDWVKYYNENLNFKTTIRYYNNYNDMIDEKKIAPSYEDGLKVAKGKASDGISYIVYIKEDFYINKRCMISGFSSEFFPNTTECFLCLRNSRIKFDMNIKHPIEKIKKDLVGKSYIEYEGEEYSTLKNHMISKIHYERMFNESWEWVVGCHDSD